MSELEIGVIGYSAQSFDESQAEEYLEDAFDRVESEYSGPFSLVSGLTDLGIPSLAYEEADSRGWRTVGVACSKADEFDCYPVDEREIVGSDWGDESERFLERIDVLIRVGGGDQAMEELEEAKTRGIQVYEYEV